MIAARTLTSADCRKTIKAEVIDYNPHSGKEQARQAKKPDGHLII